MPKSGLICAKLSECLATLEDTTIYAKKSRAKCFECLKTILDEDDGSVTASDVQRILAIFVKCMKEDVNISSFPHAITAVSSLLTNVKITPSIPVQELLPSALALLDVLKSLCATTGTENMRELCFQVLLSYSVGVLSSLTNNYCSKVLEIFTDFQSTETPISKEVCYFLQKFLHTLPPIEKKHFLKEGVGIWFGYLIPVVMNLVKENIVEQNLIFLECLESVAEALVDVDYCQCPQWKFQTLNYITDTEKFPLIIKNQLKNGSCIWHRLWIVFVKILKNQITQNIAPNGTPINSMLPVVEVAFKMDVTNRCRAFQCWDSLIDNFSKETKENCLPKRIKLLLIPLKLNNAKAEETALAKFQTWWNLIRKFQFILHKFTNEVLIAFMHFAFGKSASDNRLAINGAGHLYDSVSQLCLQAFVEIVGHMNCDCSIDLPKLNGKIMNNKLMASYWSDWMYALKTAIQMTFLMYKKNNRRTDNNQIHVLCVWRAFVMTISELPPNGVRRDMFNGLIQVLIDLIESNLGMDNVVPDILFSLTLSVSEDNENVRNVLLSTKGEEQPIHKILSVLINPGMNIFYKRHDTEKIVEMLKPLTDLTVESMSAVWLLDNLSPSGSSLKLWTALVHSVKESQIDNICPKMLFRLLLWPVEAMHQISMENNAAMLWCMIYNLHLNKLSNTELEKYILECITTQEEKNNTQYFKICLTICLLKTKLVNNDDAENLAVMLQDLTSQMFNYKEYEQAIPMLVDTIVILLHNVTENKNETLASVAINCVENLLTITFAEIKPHDCEAGKSIDAKIFTMLNNIFQAIDLLFKIELFSHATSDFVEVLREHATNLNKESALFKFIMAQMSFLLLNCSIDSVKSKIHDSIETLKEKQYKMNSNSNISHTDFTSPNLKKVVRRSKKKEASIVNTVVENGEEYVVVNSNWKFNPKKLTENQKEKFRRKRKDNNIPALYQDLSQSQDEFKLTSWKTDSQDTTTSSNSKSSKLMTNADATTILKNMPSSDIVPNIMESILTDSDKNLTSEPKTTDVNETLCDLETDKPNKTEQSSLTTPINTKSPRMALKDRVFRNVRNLIEKSSAKNYIPEKTVGERQIENVPKTPTMKPKNDTNLTSCAPPLIPPDRPSRVKRKPKKFDDVELFALKRGRNSLADVRSDLQSEIDMTVTNESQEVDLETLQNTNANVSIGSNIIITSQIIVRQSDDATEIKENEPVQDLLPETVVTAVSQTQETKNDLNEPITDDIYNTQKSEDVQDIEKDVAAQNDQKNENIEKANSHDSIESNSKTENSNNKSVNGIETLKTPVRKIKEVTQKSTTKKSATKTSRIEKELAIDMVEGHPFLKVQSEKRSTRKQITELKSTNKRKSVNEKLNKTKTIISPKRGKKSKDGQSQESSAVTVEETQDRSSSSEDAPCSEDVIESSQDSTFTTISVKSSKRTSKRKPIVAIVRLENLSKSLGTETQGLLQELDCEMLSETNKSFNQETKDDIDLPQNKTAEVYKNQSELTEIMDTEPLTEDKMTDDVIIINDDEESPIMVSNEMSVGPETEELAEADTQPNDSADFVEFESTETLPKNLEISRNPINATENISIHKDSSIAIKNQEDVIEVTTEPSESLTNYTEKDSDMCSPFKDDAQRKQDFLNNTSEISPIKIQSPDKEKTSLLEVTAETSSDYLVVKLSSPVQSNGEPFDKCGSPEFFTEDKVSPNKRDQSPPRAEVSTSSGSPSSSLSLKKNRPQAMRSGGRAAHMLGLCVSNSMNTIKNSERIEPEEPKKGNTSTPARRNLRVLYNAVSDNGETTGNNEEHDNFLKFKKALPSTDSSPSVPILKRKLVDIVDDTTASPATKRKRVSFHDPPVSTTVSVQKYIEPGGIKSPSTGHKRLERQMRSLTKSPKRLENAFVNLDTMLSKAVESFTEEQADSLTNNSLDVTPAVEVVNTSALNDTDPVCLDLVDCMDPIENIATELSSPAMKDLLIKELEGKVSTVGDLAKMTELEVNRLCIKAPKVQIAKKVLADYVNKRVINTEDVNLPEVNDTEMEISEETAAANTNTGNVAIQTNVVALCDTAMQTRTEIVKLASTQTNALSLADNSVQTEESGCKTTIDVISSCLSEREDFVDILCERLEEPSVRKISERLPANTVINILASKSNDIKLIINEIMDRQNQNMSKEVRNRMELSVLKDILCERFDSRDLILFCSQLLQTVCDKPAYI